MADANASLQQMITGLQSLGRDGLAEVAKEAAPHVRDAARKTAYAGTAPDGTPWTPKKNGDEPLQNAAEHITVNAAGPTLRIVLTGPDVFHNYGGKGKKNPKRQVIPEEVTPAIADELETSAARVIRRRMGFG